MGNDGMTIEQIRDNIAATRARIVKALADDTDAIDLLDRVFPADWGDAQLAVVWLLGNAARFATDTHGFGTEMAAEWLARLVTPQGEPRERPLLEDVAAIRLLTEWLADVDDALADDPGGHDAYVRIGARWEEGRYRARFRQRIHVAWPTPTPEEESYGA